MLTAWSICRAPQLSVDNVQIGKIQIYEPHLPVYDLFSSSNSQCHREVQPAAWGVKCRKTAQWEIHLLLGSTPSGLGLEMVSH